ncbi:MAG TPA: ATP-binding cassette domain-containing protein, partial [Ktedonobacterales bacterium]|nr:ATP-binding cassette domain-containing protein [Ktedonobacterales bacterium]
MLEARHVTLSRGGKTLVEDATFLIGRGEKVGLVGVNGAGKTTLLRALRGETEPDAGVILRPKKLGYLGQERLADALLTAGYARDDTRPDAPVTVRDVMLAARHLATLAGELRAIEAEMERATTPTTGAV